MKYNMYNKITKIKRVTLKAIFLIVLCFLGFISSLNSSFLKLDASSMSFTAFTLTGVSPKIFSPDEGNSVRFTFENPNFLEVTIKIFDITGAEVKNRLSRESENIMFWDGTNRDNELVEAGIYIYQVETSENVFNGTIVVVK